ncbi:MAG: TonB-dependent hemoglobin/transferrin/lactoferrin family receptor [Pseudomonadota bacterium]
MKLPIVSTLIGATVLALPALADEVVIEDVITVVGTKTERTLNQVGATITVIDEETIEQQVVRDIADLVRYEPGVTVSGTGSRFGLSGFNIRGIDGNRVVTVVDGVRVPDEFSFGPFLSARRDFVDVDSIQVVEIARGPISSLYGSDALGGVVSFTTRGPRGYVSEADPFYAGVSLGHSTDDASLSSSVRLAAGNDRIAAMLTYTHRDAEETETSGGSGGTAAARQQADPQDISSDNIALKVELGLAEGHTLSLDYDNYQFENDAQILSDYGLLLGGFGPPTLINSRDSFDERQRDKVTLGYRYEGEGLIDSADIKIYQQSSLSEQRTDERRTPASGPQTRFRYSEFEQDISGFYLQLGSAFEVGDVSHVLTYGVDYYDTESKSLRNGGTFDLAGVPQFEFSPLPTRDFPITEVEQLAFFIQDEIVLMDDRLRLTPGVRFDSFDADAEPDAVYLGGNPGTPTPEDYDDSEVTVSLSAVYAFSDAFTGYVRYSEGFRAPPYDDVNVGFTNPIGGYKTISNPNLTSETSQGVELGLRWNGELGDLNLAVYQNDYEDFIESFAIAPAFLPFGGIDPADNFLTFQSINRAEVEIDGVELSGYLALGELSDAFTGFGVRMALAYADGEDLDADEPLDSIEPLTGVIGLQYDADRWGMQVVLSLVEGKDPDDISSSGRLATSGYGVLDIMGYVDFTDNITLNVGLFNVGDREYIRWADTISIGGDAPERFTQPGFNAGATLKIDL